jgi:hypothetical protein
MNLNGKDKQRVWQDIQKNEPELAKLLVLLKQEFGEIRLERYEKNVKTEVGQGSKTGLDA